jgi:hypothetical protein
MVVFAETVVARLKARPVLLASSRLPPERFSAPVPSAAALVVTRNVPEETAVAPVNVLTPESVSKPVPDWLSPPAPLLIPLNVVLAPPEIVAR